jgi:hypothetical protein
MMEVTPLLEAAGVKLRGLEAAVSTVLDEEGREVAEAVAEYVLTCIRSWTQSSPSSRWSAAPSQSKELPQPSP